MIYIGIDPGKKGGIAIIKEDKLLCFEMPITAIGEIDIQLLYATIRCAINEKDIFCCIEKSQSMPSQSSVATFNYGKGYGKLLALLEILEISYQEIHPMKWKKEFSLIKKDKAQSIVVAEKLFPLFKGKFITERGRKKDGMAEALLIAEYAKRIKGDI